jgi:hypothetical protein
MERRIFRRLSFAPADLAEQLNADGFAREFAAYRRVCHERHDAPE